MTDPKILYILESFASRGDIYGNRYWWHRVTSTETGRSLVFEACSDGNARNCVNTAVGPLTHPELYSSTITDIPIREHNRQMKNCTHSEGGSESLSMAILNLTD